MGKLCKSSFLMKFSFQKFGARKIQVSTTTGVDTVPRSTTGVNTVAINQQ